MNQPIDQSSVGPHPGAADPGKVLLIGVTGGTGSHVVQGCLDQKT